jgi:formiminoglutamase
MLQEIIPYVQPYTSKEIDSLEITFVETQLGHQIQTIQDIQQDISSLDLILVGCGEMRGQQPTLPYSNAPDKIREELYSMYSWNPDIRIGDLGNIIQGNSWSDTKAALKTVLTELHDMGKRVLLLGGSHDLTLSQYDVFRSKQQAIDFTVVDMLVDLNELDHAPFNTYLMDALTSSPNFVRQFNLIGFQSYYTNPNLIETFDKLRFDCIRLGKAREDMDQLEPLLRSSQVCSIDMNAVRYSDAPANRFSSPNGFQGDEICRIMQFAGMSHSVESLGLYGYDPNLDNHNLTARLMAQMIWYYIDGIRIRKIESDLEDTDQFLQYHLSFTEQNATFLKSKKTNRWWMQLPNGNFIPCTYKDYVTACNNEMPERWMREMERII